MPRILVVDDDVEHVRMLSEYLCAEGFAVDAVHNGADALEAALSGNFDAVILDVMLPRLSGTDVLRTVRLTSHVPVLMLTAKGDDIDRIVGLELGADDYVAKPFLPRELVARLRAVLRRQGGTAHGAGEAILTNGRIVVEPDKRQARVDSAALDLTVSEFNVLVALLRSVDKVVSKDELSIQALGRNRAPYDRSVDVHVSNLRQKMAAAGAAHGLETVRGVGYRIVSAS